MYRSKIRVVASLLLAVSLVVGLTSLAIAKPPETIPLQILAINDFHGALDPGSVRGGAEYLSTFVSQQRAETENTIFVSGGDLIGASPLLSALFHDEPTINAFNLMGLEFSAVGNHEFDEGVAELERIQSGGCNPIDGCLVGDFLGANFKFMTANVFKDQNDKPLFSPYKVRSFAGVKVAFIGVSLEATPTIVSAAGTAGVYFTSEIEAISNTVAEIKDQHPDVKTMILIIHDGGYQSDWINSCTNFRDGPFLNVLANIDPEIDLIITAHTHNAYNCNIDNRVVTSSGNNGNFLTDIDLTLNRETGEIVTKTVNNIEILHNVAKDPAMTALLAPYRALAAPLANRVIGMITADIKRSGNMAESALGDVIADAQLAATSDPAYGGAVVAFMNPGGIRTDLLYATHGGNVTYGDAFTVQPFSNILVTMTLTGAQIKALLEQQWTAARMLQISNGFTYSWSASAPIGSKISNIMINGVPIDPTASYRITCNNFLAGGGDKFYVFQQGTDLLTGAIDLDAFVDYFLDFYTQGLAVPPGPMNRVTQLP
jgi:5'-nucleotidase